MKLSNNVSSIFILFYFCFFSCLYSASPENGGFENNLINWEDPSGSVAIVYNPHQGTKACLLTGGLIAGPLNGSFESNLQSWSLKSGNAIIINNGYSESKGCQIGTTATSTESTIWSNVFSVTPNKDYYLSSFVRHIGGNGFYKVTIAWLDQYNNVILPYVNDWKGIDKPSSFTFHGGCFRSPANARSVQLYIGTSAYTSFNFDLVSFGEVQLSSLTSSTIVVTGGKYYKLSSYVRQLNGPNFYKVTILWYGIYMNYLSMSNDWKGTDKPVSYKYHGGFFRAPNDAKYAKIILGVSEQTSVCFDSISLAKAYLTLDNGNIKIGADGTWGGAIEYLATSAAPAKNYVENYDAGRLIQFAVWGTPKNAYDWFGNAHPWNPVQGGDWVIENEYETGVIDFEYTNQNKTIYIKCQPLNWGLKNGTPERSNVIFQIWYTLEGNAVKIDYIITNNAENHSDYVHQELPCAYLIPELDNIVFYNGVSPFQNDPGLTRVVPPDSPAISYSSTEYWVAYLNSNDFGVGLFTQNNLLFSAHYQLNTDIPNSYLGVSPINSISPNTVIKGTAYCVLDSLQNIRNFVYAKKKYPSDTNGILEWNFNEINNRLGWHGIQQVVDNAVSSGKWKLYAKQNSVVRSPEFQIIAANLKKIQIALKTTNVTSAYISWSKNTDSILAFPFQKTFNIINDGAMHVYDIDMTNEVNWSGILRQIQFSNIGNESNVQIDYIKIKQ